MPKYLLNLKLSSQGRIQGSGKGVVHGIAYGPKKITPGSLNHDLFQMKSQYDASMGAMTGRRQHQPIVITKEKDSASPLLWQACTNNELLSSLVLNLIEYSSPGTGGKETPAATIHLTNATIEKYKTYYGLIVPKPHGSHATTSNKDTNELEEFEITFQKITFTNVFKSKSMSDDWTA